MAIIEQSSTAQSRFPNGIGVDNQTGKLVDVLLGRPDSYEWREELNAISAQTFVHKDMLGLEFNRDLAMRQHAGLVDAFADAGVRCHYLPADDGLTSSVFARDSTFMTPWGPVVAAVQTPPRRRDYAVVTKFYEAAEVPIWNWVTAGYFEGGDFAIIEPGVAMLGYSGTRSTKPGAEQVKGWLEREGWEVLACPIAPQFVHMDAVLVMLSPGLALVCEDALETYALDWLDAHNVKRIPVTYRECVILGGNVVNLGEERIISMTQNTSVNEKLAAEGFKVTAIDYEQFTLGGGGVHCSSHELRRLDDSAAS